MSEVFEGVLKGFPGQLERGLEFSKGVKIDEGFDEVFVLGVGGSALGGLIAKSYLKERNCSVPVTLHKNYGLPRKLSKESLVLAFSYSGNTEETLNAFENCAKITDRIVSVTTGGKLLELSKEKGLQSVVLQSGMPPRFAAGYFFAVTVGLLAKTGKAPKECVDELVKTSRNVAGKDFTGLAEGLARESKGKIPIIYSTDKYSPVAFSWKFNFNETSKIPSFWHTFPDVNHNETAGYEETDVAKFHFYMLRDNEDDKRCSQRMEITSRIVTENGNTASIIDLQGNSYLEKMLWGLCLGNWTTYFKAKELGKDPADPGLVSVLKRELAKTG
ncbi:MAG TPA: bifunctional phosphoglucose/phosphomannose isomerase [archaeon]|nr:bifunctional phosphoglucose/phosphomannose isomerase [archaeon]